MNAGRLAVDQPIQRAGASFTRRPSLHDVDLHNHMPLPEADYRGPLTTSAHQVVLAALAADIHVLGITDHFSLGFFRRAHEAAQGTPLLVLPGTEVRLTHGQDEAHIVALFPPDDAEARFAAFMDAIGFREDARTDGLHRVVVECDPVRAGKAVAGLGGACIVAHVDRFFGDYRLLGRPLLRRVIEEVPGVALEFVDADNAALLDAAAADVAIVQGSDSHRTDEIGRRRSVISARELTFEAVRDALRCGLRAPVPAI